MIRRIGEAVRPDVRYRVRPGAYAVLWRDGMVLLTHQSRPYPEFQLPGGGIDPGESPIPALHREVLEETGWCISISHRLGCFRRFTFMPEYNFWAEKVCQVYLARPTYARCDPSEPHHSVHWASPEAAIALVGNDGDRLLLKKAFGL